MESDADFFGFFAHNVKKTIVEFIWWLAIVILTTRNPFKQFLKTLGRFTPIFKSAVLKIPYLGRGWMDFFDTHIKMTARAWTLTLSQSPYMSEHYKYPKNSIFQKVGRFPSGNYKSWETAEEFHWMDVVYLVYKFPSYG